MRFPEISEIPEVPEQNLKAWSMPRSRFIRIFIDFGRIFKILGGFSRFWEDFQDFGRISKASEGFSKDSEPAGSQIALFFH